MGSCLVPGHMRTTPTWRRPRVPSWIEQATRSGRWRSAQRSMRSPALIDLWPSAAWRAAGLRSATDWLTNYAGLSRGEARRLAAIAELCDRDDVLASTQCCPVGCRWAGPGCWPRAVTDERVPWLTDDAAANFVALAESTSTDEDFNAAVRWWTECVDQELSPRNAHGHSLQLTPRLFGGGDIVGSLAPTAFATFIGGGRCPHPGSRPGRRPLPAHLQRTPRRRPRRHGHSTPSPTTTTTTPSTTTATSTTMRRAGRERAAERAAERAEDEAIRAADTFDGWMPTDDLDEQLDPANSRSRPARTAPAPDPQGGGAAAAAGQRRIKARSGTRVNVVIDLRTLAMLRDFDDFDDLILRGEGWNAARAAAEELLCDSTLVATLFDGGRIIDSNDEAERFSKRQRRAIAARDRCCVFPGCTRPPRHCDIHHLHERNRRRTHPDRQRGVVVPVPPPPVAPTPVETVPRRRRHLDRHRPPRRRMEGPTNHPPRRRLTAP